MREGRDAEEVPKRQEGAHGEATLCRETTRRREQHVPETPTLESVPRLPPVRAVSSIGQRGSTQKLATYECFT